MKLIEWLSRVPLFKRILDNDKLMYLIMGGCTTVVNLLSYRIMILIFGNAKMTVTICNTISVILAIIFAFFANKIFVFRSVSPSLRHAMQEFLKFAGARMSTLGIEVGGVYLLYNVLGVNDFLAKFLTQFIVIVVNYFISKFFVFVKQEEHS